MCPLIEGVSGCNKAAFTHSSSSRELLVHAQSRTSLPVTYLLTLNHILLCSVRELQTGIEEAETAVVAVLTDRVNAAILLQFIVTHMNVVSCNHKFQGTGEHYLWAESALETACVVSLMAARAGEGLSDVCRERDDSPMCVENEMH